MLLSLNWLKDFVDIPPSITPQELGTRLTMHTVEIDNVIREEDKYRNIIVAEIKKIKKHPNADKLQLVEVNIGDKILKIVCGAFNIKTGQKVPVALVGAVLPNGVEISEVVVRGEKSEGMLCAEDELGIGEDHSGIVILSNHARIGEELGKYLKLRDVIYEVDNKSITNRPDLWSHFGIAREISTFLGIKNFDYKINFQKEKIKSKNRINVNVKDFNLCPRYMALSISGIKVETSPRWIKDRLVAVGVRPINNIVDITNYIMMEIGQPLHAFDKEAVDKIIVRRAKNKEKITTLDSVSRDLNEEDLVIADSKKAIAIAGIMGGDASEINSETKEIIIESANFNFLSIRKTVQRLGIRTEASQRFEKSLDPNLCEVALLKAAEMIMKNCPGSKISSSLTDENKFGTFSGPIELNLDWLNKFIGSEVEEKKVISILKSLGFGIKEKGKRNLSVLIPSWRATKDISIKEDLAEEVARIIGYDNLKPQVPKVSMDAPMPNNERNLERKIKNFLSLGAGFSEVYNYSFVNEILLQKLQINSSGHIRLLNPISEQYTLLRQSLSPLLIENIRKNQSRKNLIKLYEIGDIYLTSSGEINKSDKEEGKLPYQEKRLGIIVAGDKKDDAMSLVKGALELFLDVEYFSFNNPPDWVEEGFSAEIKSGGLTIGSLYNLKTGLAKSLGIKKEVAVAEIIFGNIKEVIDNKGDKKFREYEKYPPVVRDLAFVVNEKVLYNNIREEIIKHHDYIKSVELFDVYSGNKLGKEKKSLAFHIIYQADKTLRGEEVDEIQQSLLNKLKDKFAAKIRDF